jgi:RNA polymerase sigma factor (sigma-70 family)
MASMADADESERLALLMQAAQRGDAAAYTELLLTVTPRVRRAVASKRGFLGADAVEDLVQDVLLSVHAVRATYDSGRPFMPWLLAIIRNRLADSARRYARREAHEVVVDDLDVTFAGAPTNPEMGEYRDPDALRTAIGALPPGQRSAIEMVKLRNMSLKEAAAASGSSVGALKLATHRAMASLRRMLVKDS